MINEQKIRVFLSLANTLNFTETANQLFITQQAVSKHISQLEDDLGFRLFIRSTHNVRLTAAGERCQAFFREKMLEFSDFLLHEKEFQRRLSKSIRIGYNDWLDLGDSIGAARVKFHEQYPDIAHIPERQPPDVLQSKLRNDELDIILILRRFLRQETGLRIVELADFPMSIMVNKSIAAIQPLTVRQLSAFPLLINSFSAESYSETVLRARNEMALFGLENEKIVVTPNRDSVYTAVETGEGIATACSFTQTGNGIAMIPTKVTDTLVCVCMEDNRRKLVSRYMSNLKAAFREERTSPSA